MIHFCGWDTNDLNAIGTLVSAGVAAIGLIGVGVGIYLSIRALKVSSSQAGIAKKQTELSENQIKLSDEQNGLIARQLEFSGKQEEFGAAQLNFIEDQNKMTIMKAK